jgi:hypothetical protein
MEDAINSRARARLSQGWKTGQLLRIGDPFHSREEAHSPWTAEGTDVGYLLEYVTAYDEKYPTPKEIQTDDFDDVLKFSEEVLKDLIKLTAPFLDSKKWDEETNGQALMRTQDYGFIKTFAKDLKKGCNHVDIGPGLGSHALYSMKGLESNYIGIETQPHMFKVQRIFQRLLSSKCQMKHGNNFNFFDALEAETFGLTWDEISNHLKKNQNKPGLSIVPSWMFKNVPSSSIDLATATFMLNEVPVSAILWLFSNLSRSMKKGAYFYINDNSKQKDEVKLKPERANAMDYDSFLTKIGFIEVKRMNMENRVNYRGSPRIYQKESDKIFTYQDLADMHVGKFAVSKYY